MINEAPVYRVGSLFLNTTTASSSITQVFIPSQNLRGAIIRTCMIASSNSNSGFLYADSTVPSTYLDNTKRIIFANADTVTVSSYAILTTPLYIDSGLGVWFGSASTGAIYITWDFLS